MSAADGSSRSFGHRGRKDDPLYRARRMLHTGASLLTDRQIDRLAALFDETTAPEEHAHVQATWGIYQRMIAAYREPDRRRGRDLMTALISSLSAGVPAGLVELTKTRPHPEATSRRRPGLLRPPRHLERPDRGPSTDDSNTSAAPRWGFRNLTNYTARCLLEAGGFKPQLHPQL